MCESWLQISVEGPVHVDQCDKDWISCPKESMERNPLCSSTKAYFSDGRKSFWWRKTPIILLKYLHR